MANIISYFHEVMIIEEKSIGDMPELGGMGILKATNMNEFKELCILKNYIIYLFKTRQNIRLSEIYAFCGGMRIEKKHTYIV